MPLSEEEQFCKVFSEFYGEEITSISQIAMISIDGRELFELMKALKKQNN